MYVLQNQAPTVVVTSPTEGATVERGTIHVMTQTSPAPGYSYNFAVDGTTPPNGSGSSIEFLWDTSAVKAGSHLLVVTVQEAAGKIVARATRTVTVLP